MENERAIDVLEHIKSWCGLCPIYDAEIEALNIAISAIGAQQEAQKNDPLTLEELLSMVRKPAYMVFSEKDKGQWYLITSISGEKIKFCDSDANPYHCYKNDYGPEWLAYCHPPKEAPNV